MKNRKVLRRRRENLIFHFALLSGILTVTVIFLCGIVTYILQANLLKKNALDNARSIGKYLEQLIQNSGEEFIQYKDYYMKHFKEVDIPHCFKDYNEALKQYELLQHNLDPNHVAGKLRFESENELLRKAYFIYLHEFWVTTFEDARIAFDIPYTYFLVPKDDVFKMVYMIDGERSIKDCNGIIADRGEYLYLGDEYYDDPDVYKIMWNTWFTGRHQNKFEVWDNHWGHTYAYYTPVIINGIKVGLIGTEVEVKNINRKVLINSVKVSSIICTIFIICIIFFGLVINHRFLVRISILEHAMKAFAENKNPAIADQLSKEIKSNNEIDSLYQQFSNLILELEQYMNRLVETSKALNDSKKWADAMNSLANKDSLTGVRNKTSYDNEVKRLEWKIADGSANFGIVMIDLNFLKRTNDTYGHEQGNIAIQRLCHIICNVFEKSPVFRIGGDEFVVILENDDYNKVDELVEEFNIKLSSYKNDTSLNPWERVSAAIGYSLFDGKTDKCVAHVFQRADKNMYNRKKEMKSIRKS